MSSFMAGAFLLVVGGQANAQQVTRADFFDFDRAVGFWTEMTTRGDLEAAYQPACSEGPYVSWKAEMEKGRAAAIAGLENNPDAARIRECHDLMTAYQQWRQIYTSWLTGREMYGEPWNQTTHGMTCTVIEQMNIFTGQCNDLPDWRKADWAAEDARLDNARERFLARRQGRQ